MQAKHLRYLQKKISSLSPSCWIGLDNASEHFHTEKPVHTKQFVLITVIFPLLSRNLYAVPSVKV